MKPVARAVVEAGLVDSSILRELRRWGAPLYDPGTDEQPEPGDVTLRNADEVVAHIREALEGEDQVRIDETDLDLLRMYLDDKHKKTGRLTLRDGKSRSSKSVDFCLTPMGEYAIPWTDTATEPDILYNGESHLRWVDNGRVVDVRFTGARDVFFGEHRAFVVCEVMKDG